MATTPMVTVAIHKLPIYSPDADDGGDLTFYGGVDEDDTIFLLRTCCFYKVGDTIYITDRQTGTLSKVIAENKFLCLFVEQ